MIKPVVSELHLKRHVVAGYIDDFILLNETYEGCTATVAETIISFGKLGFVVPPHESVFIPNQSLVFLLNKYIRKTSAFQKDGMKQLVLSSTE